MRTAASSSAAANNKSNAGAAAAVKPGAGAGKPTPATKPPAKPAATAAAAAKPATAAAAAAAPKPTPAPAKSYNNEDDDEWGDSVSSPPKKQTKTADGKKATDDDDWDAPTGGDGDDAGAGWDDDDDGKPAAAAAPIRTVSQTDVKTSSSRDDYTILEPAALHSRQEALVKQTSELLFLNPTEAACLLRHYGWKSQKLQSEWLADSAKVRTAAGLSEAKTLSGAAAASKTVQCAAAFCDVVSKDEATALNCGHWFCDTCWTGHLVSQVTHGRSCVFATCMGMRCTLNHPHKFGCACKELVPESVVKKYVKEAALIEKYDRWLLESFVEGQRSIKWCPNGKCGNAVEYKTGGMKSIACKCGHRFCFSCNQPAHTPAPCDLVAKWLLKEKSDDATEIWLAARTKQCPKCLVRIEKNKACNHMSCSKCNHQFCWLCKGPWDKHGSSTGGYYVCNKYNEDTKSGNVGVEEKSILENQKLLQKYEYYYKRFKSSADAIKFTLEINKRIEAKTQNMEITRFSFLTEAVDKLVDARRVLEWSYCLSYYLKEGGKKALFEYQQQMLVGNTEALQDVMDNTTDIDKLISLRDSIINKTRTMDKFRQEMVAQIERGDFEELLLNKADASLGNVWTCSGCKTDNKKDAEFCIGCQACVKHGEPECKACAKKT